MADQKEAQKVNLSQVIQVKGDGAESRTVATHGTTVGICLVSCSYNSIGSDPVEPHWMICAGGQSGCPSYLLPCEPPSEQPGGASRGL